VLFVGLDVAYLLTGIVVGFVEFVVDLHNFEVELSVSLLVVLLKYPLINHSIEEKGCQRKLLPLSRKVPYSNLGLLLI